MQTIVAIIELFQYFMKSLKIANKLEIQIIELKCKNRHEADGNLKFH